jgi:hypothetical protein
MINERNASYIYIQNVACGISDNAAFDTTAAGSVVIAKGTGLVESGSALAATDTYRVIQKKADGTYVFSPYFNSSTVSNAKKVAYAAATEQVSYWGYDGTYNTTGLGTITTGNTYTLHFVLNHTRNIYNNAPQIKTVPYKAMSTSESALAAGLHAQFLRTFSLDREPAQTIKCERVYSGAQLNALGTATAALTNGSNAVVFSENMTSLVTAGTILRFGTSGAGTAPCYIVTSHNSGAAAARVYYLDVPYQGTTTAALAAASVESAATGGYWGLKFTGVAQSFDPIVDSLTNNKVYFDITSEDFGTVVEYKATKMSPGSGTYPQVAYQEIYSQFLDKDPIVSVRPRTKYRQEATSGYTYTLYTFTVNTSDIHWNATGINNKSYVNITIAVKSDLVTDIGYFDTVLGVS